MRDAGRRTRDAGRTFSDAFPGSLGPVLVLPEESASFNSCDDKVRTYFMYITLCIIRPSWFKSQFLVTAQRF